MAELAAGPNSPVGHQCTSPHDRYIRLCRRHAPEKNLLTRGRACNAYCAFASGAVPAPGRHRMQPLLLSSPRVSPAWWGRGEKANQSSCRQFQPAPRVSRTGGPAAMNSEVTGSPTSLWVRNAGSAPTTKPRDPALCPPVCTVLCLWKHHRHPIAALLSRGLSSPPGGIATWSAVLQPRAVVLTRLNSRNDFHCGLAFK